MLIYAALALGLSAAWPLWVAWRSTRGSTIRHALAWAWLAWAAWLWYGYAGGPIPAYAALTLTACAGIAVFGARRPGVVAWHFVVLGLLVVLWLPWAEGLVSGRDLHVGHLHQLFLCAILGFGLVNYLPTRTGAFAIGLIPGCLLLALRYLWYGDSFDQSSATLTEMIKQRFTARSIAIGLSIANAGWAPFLMLRQPRKGSATDQLWARFRDRFGAVWALRLREQFNAAAQNAGWPVRLGWFGLVPKTDQPAPEWHTTLVALQKRFNEP